jgi:hypothetical protein
VVAHLDAHLLRSLGLVLSLSKGLVLSLSSGFLGGVLGQRPRHLSHAGA